MPQTPADKLVKQLETELYSAGLTPLRLRPVGWFDFRNLDRPDAGDPIAIAVAAFPVVCIDGDVWNRDLQALGAILSFLKARSAEYPTPADMARLVAVLKANPVEMKDVEDWFRRNHRIA